MEKKHLKLVFPESLDSNWLKSVLLLLNYWLEFSSLPLLNLHLDMLYDLNGSFLLISYYTVLILAQRMQVIKHCKTSKFRAEFSHSRYLFPKIYNFIFAKKKFNSKQKTWFEKHTFMFGHMKVHDFFD